MSRTRARTEIEGVSYVRQDEAYKAAGATLGEDKALGQDIVLKVLPAPVAPPSIRSISKALILLARSCGCAGSYCQIRPPVTWIAASCSTTCCRHSSTCRSAMAREEKGFKKEEEVWGGGGRYGRRTRAARCPGCGPAPPPSPSCGPRRTRASSRACAMPTPHPSARFHCWAPLFNPSCLFCIVHRD